jgi:hypothetical protein
MADERRGAFRTSAGQEKALDDHAERLDQLEDRVLLVETKESSRERKANRALTGVIALGISIASGVAVALFSGGHP